MYVLEFAGFEPATADTRGYMSEDFLTAAPPASFTSEAEAKEWLASHDKGPDCEGVTASWRIELA